MKIIIIAMFSIFYICTPDNDICSRISDLINSNRSIDSTEIECFLSSFKPSNNIEFTEQRNELLFDLLAYAPTLTISSINQQKQDVKNIIYDELENPLSDLINLQHLIHIMESFKDMDGIFPIISALKKAEIKETTPMID